MIVQGRPVRFVGALVWSAALSVVSALVASQPVRAQSERTSFRVSAEFYGPIGYSNPDAASVVGTGMANMVAFWPPADAGMADFIGSRAIPLNFHMQGASHVNGDTAAQIEFQRVAAGRICAASPVGGIWSLMLEWDQSGGAWVPAGRPSYAGLSRAAAHARFLDYYLTQSPPLGAHLNRPVSERPCRLAAVTDYSPNAFDAFRMGVDVGLLERGIDELGDIATGVAFIRGAGRQFDRPWGIDISTWRTAADSATTFDAQGRQTGGWSVSYLRRHFYAAYLAGAHILQIEPTLYFDPSGTTFNPFGRMVKSFASFSLRRHPDIGAPVVPLALMISRHSGFDTKHGPYNQQDAVWYQDIPYSSGDYMIDNLLRLAFPGHSLHGTIPGAPFSTPQGYQQFLASGGDPRPFEPMPTTRWGDVIDIVQDSASPAAFARYKIIVLAGGVVIDARLRSALEAWVRRGGTLVVNARQASVADEALLGVRLVAAYQTDSASRWLADNKAYLEKPFRYRRVALVSAKALAATAGGDTLIAANAVGAGRVILTTPDYLQTSARDELLKVGVRLLDSLAFQVAPARVAGPPAQILFNTAQGRLVTTIINNSGATWNGTVTAEIGGKVDAVREYLTDQPLACSRAGKKVSVAGRVPPYDLRVYAIEYSPGAPAHGAAC